MCLVTTNTAIARPGSVSVWPAARQRPDRTGPDKDRQPPQSCQCAPPVTPRALFIMPGGPASDRLGVVGGGCYGGRRRRFRRPACSFTYPQNENGLPRVFWTLAQVGKPRNGWKKETPRSSGGWAGGGHAPNGVRPGGLEGRGPLRASYRRGNGTPRGHHCGREVTLISASCIGCCVAMR